MFMSNDPFLGGGQHLPDINIIAPVFSGDEPIAFVANIAHHADVGGMVPGSESIVCRTIYQEGIRLPPIQVVRQNNIIPDIIDLVAANSRTPDERRGDLRAQIAANRIGLRRFQTCLSRYGQDLVLSSLESYLAATEQRFRTRLASLDDQTIEVVDYLDPDLFGDDSPLPIHLTLKKVNDRLHLDFTGSAAALSSARNVPLSALHSTVYAVIKMLMDPELPANSGYFGAIEIAAPEGCFLNPKPGAAVGARALPCAVIGDVVAQALAKLVPEKAIASGGPHHQAIFAGKDETGKMWVNYETYAGAQGARPYRDGVDGVRIHASGASNLPVEALEQVYPLRVLRYALRDGTGGKGTFRGGSGIVRDYEMLNATTISLAAERQVVSASGIAGGAAGSPGQFVLNPQTDRERILSSAAGDMLLAAGDILSIRTPGSGGYGPENRRAKEMIERDKLEKRT
ncbi:N-methylhydantoinase B [Salipiger profundus]|nr:N-methylhydantoinase B [Salipiger profundus]